MTDQLQLALPGSEPVCVICGRPATLTRHGRSYCERDRPFGTEGAPGFDDLGLPIDYEPVL